MEAVEHATCGLSRGRPGAQMEGEEIILGPFDPGDFATIVFIHKNGLVLEYLQYHDTNNWFGQDTPWIAP